jgi:uncharacterized membrane protein
MSTNGRPHLPVTALDPTKNNVEAIARLESEALLSRSLGERVSDAVVKFIGTASFVAVHLAWFGVWVVVNFGWIPTVPVFDPFPFGILTLIVSAEGVLLAIFILVSQNRMTRQADRRAHLDLQVNMLAEQELTLMLQMQEQLCHRLGVDVRAERQEAQHLMEHTNVEDIVQSIEEKLPSE